MRFFPLALLVLSGCFGATIDTDGVCYDNVEDSNGVVQKVEVACSEAATTDPDTSGVTTTASMTATAVESEIYGAAVGEYGYCLASWVNTYPGYAIGTFGEGFGPTDGWQVAVATASMVNGSYCTSFRNFGGGAFRWGAAVVDPSTFEPLIWIELDELEESAFIIDVLECDLDDPEDLVRKQNFCAAYDNDGNAIEADCGLTYVPPPECSEDEDTDDNGDDTDDAGGGTIDDEEQEDNTDTDTEDVFGVTIEVDLDSTVDWAEIMVRSSLDADDDGNEEIYWPDGTWDEDSEGLFTISTDGGSASATFDLAQCGTTIYVNGFGETTDGTDIWIVGTDFDYTDSVEIDGETASKDGAEWAVTIDCD